MQANLNIESFQKTKTFMQIPCKKLQSKAGDLYLMITWSFMEQVWHHNPVERCSRVFEQPIVRVGVHTWYGRDYPVSRPPEKIAESCTEKV